MNVNVLVIASIVWLVTYILFLSAIVNTPLPDSVMEIAKMAVTGLFGIVTGAAGAIIAMNRRADDQPKNATAPTSGKEGG